MSSSSLWQRFQQHFLYYRDLGFSLDISRMKFPDDFFEKMQPQIDKAFAAMRALETGAIANPTEQRMVGHYWLRNPALAPTPEIRTEIEETIKRIKTFAAEKSRLKMENLLSTCCSLASAVRRSGRNSSQTRSDHGMIR
jgi:glucose-6-phosphate isomerase